MDYRRVDEKTFCDDVENKKVKLLQKLGKRIKVHYDHIKNRDSLANTEFLSIYGFSCVYCGIGELFINRTDLEVDHFVCESAFKQTVNGKEIIDRKSAGNINNLVASCSLCNRRKSNLIISSDTANLINIDKNLIANVFERDKKSFKILIKDEYKNNLGIVELYHKLNLGSDLKRLEYMGLKLDYIIKNNNLDDENLSKLREILIILIKRHNITYDFSVNNT